MTWDPATTGGVAEVGLLALPWIPLVLYIGVVAAIAYGTRPLEAKPEAIGRLRPFAIWVAFLLPLFGIALVRDWDPLWAGDELGPGPAVIETRADGTWMSDSIEHASAWSWTVGEPCLSECVGPRYVYRLVPGEPYTFVASVRNASAMPISILGRPPSLIPESQFGLALLRDSSVMSADPSNLRSFEPVQLAAGASVPVVFVARAPSCADPEAPIARLSGGHGAATGYPLTYDLFGWRRTGTIWPHVSIAIAGCPD